MVMEALVYILTLLFGVSTVIIIKIRDIRLYLLYVWTSS